MFDLRIGAIGIVFEFLIAPCERSGGRQGCTTARQIKLRSEPIVSADHSGPAGGFIGGKHDWGASPAVGERRMTSDFPEQPNEATGNRLDDQ